MKRKSKTANTVLPYDPKFLYLVHRGYNMDRVVSEIEAELGAFASGSDVLAGYAKTAIDWTQALDEAMKAGDAHGAASLALCVGALCERIGLEGIFQKWPSQTQAARNMGLKRYEVNRLIEREELETNGKTGHACRGDPASILAYCTQNGIPWNGDSEDLDQDDARASQKIAKMKREDRNNW